MLLRFFLLAAVCAAGARPAWSQGDTFDFEVGAAYQGSSASSRFSSVLPDPFGPVVSQSNTDFDEIAVSGTWFPGGASSRTGPLSRAAFVSQASSLSVHHARGSGSSRFTTLVPNPPVPPTAARSNQDSETTALDLRYVWASGWYGLAGLSLTETDSGTPAASFGVDSDAYALGVGKYIGPQTTIDLRVTLTDFGGNSNFIGDSDITATALSLAHIGDLGTTWQYGADVSIGTTDQSGVDESLLLRLSLYPTRSVAFGIETQGSLQDAFDTGTRYSAFASWFPTNNLEIAASYGFADLDFADSLDADEDRLGIGLNWRF